VLDRSRATEVWAWELNRPIGSILTEIAGHAEEHPDWVRVNKRLSVQREERPLSDDTRPERSET
jgi:hypothetical protein